MGFIDSYKRLEKLCGEILNNDRRISAYIDEMLNTPSGSRLVSGWDEDLKQLKHYRWIRNQIVHDPSCSEENMCSDADTQWIVDFYARIMDQTDPLALYRKATHLQHTPIKKRTEWRYDYYNYNSYRVTRRLSSRAVALLIIVIVVALTAIMLLIK